MQRSETLERDRVYRFSDAVHAIGSTPKSLRRWMITLEMTPKDGSWTEFTPAQLLALAIMRHLVDWGVGVPKAAELAVEMLRYFITGAEPDSGDQWTFDRLGDESELTALSLAELVMGMQDKRAYLSQVIGTYLIDYENIKTKKSWFSPRTESKSDLISGGASALVLNIGNVASALHIRLTEPELRDFDLRQPDRSGL